MIHPRKYSKQGSKVSPCFNLVFLVTIPRTRFGAGNYNDTLLANLCHPLIVSTGKASRH